MAMTIPLVHSSNRLLVNAPWPLVTPYKYSQCEMKTLENEDVSFYLRHHSFLKGIHIDPEQILNCSYLQRGSS